MICVQIYGAWTLEDSLALVEMGVDHLGVEVHEGREENAAQIVRGARGKTTVSLLPLFKELDRVIAITKRLQPDILHFCESDMTMDFEQLALIREQVAPTRIMQAIPVGPPAIAHRFDSLALAKRYDPHVDYLLLDTSLGDDEDNPVPGWVGATGRTHDWRISRAIVEQCRSPVILAGGLDPDNVAESIRAVRPWGVDSCTGLNLYRGKKDLVKSRAFIEIARSTAAEIGM